MEAEEERFDWDDEEVDREGSRSVTSEMEQGAEVEREDGEIREARPRRMRDEECRELRVELNRVPGGARRDKWLSDTTRLALSRAIIGPNRDQCRHCDFLGESRRVRIHVRQHFTRNYCRCGFHSASRDTVVEHVKKRGSSHGPVHEVDRATYQEFARAMGWTDVPAFPECRPILGNAYPTDARRRIEERLEIRGLRLEPPRKRQASVKSSRVEVQTKRRRSRDREEYEPKKLARRCGAELESERRPRDDGRSQDRKGHKSDENKKKVEKVRRVPASTAPPPPEAPRPPAEPEVEWRAEMLASAAVLRQQVAQLRFQADQTEQQANRMERIARGRRPDEQREGTNGEEEGPNGEEEGQGRDRD